MSEHDPAADYPAADCPAADPHDCPAVRSGEAARLVACVRREPYLLRALDAVAASGLPGAWIGAGVIRDVVWGQQHGGFDPASVRDVDVAFFDAGDLSSERDRAAQRVLAGLAALPWEATNQAAVHTWYHGHFGGPPVPPFTRVHDAVATWPETATCVAIRLAPRPAGEDGPASEDGPAGDDRPAGEDHPASENGRIEVCAPHGLADLLSMTWRRNPVRVSEEVSRARLARMASRWPRLTIVPLAS